jgi:allantoin racemase
MKLLVVNSNTSTAATERIRTGCEPHLRPGAQASYLNAEAGPQGIDSLLDVAVSGIETLRLIARHRDDYDAFVVACGLDPMLDAARQVTDKPVVGIAEAGMLFACTLGATFSILITNRAQTSFVRETVRHYGLERRLASVRALETTTAQMIGGLDQMHDRLVAAARQAVEEDLAEVIVLTGSIFGLVAPAIAPRVGVPVLSGLVCAVKLAQDLVELGVRTSHVYTYRTPAKRDRLLGYEDLQAVYSSGGPSGGGPSSP